MAAKVIRLTCGECGAILLISKAQDGSYEVDTIPIRKKADEKNAKQEQKAERQKDETEDFFGL